MSRCLRAKAQRILKEPLDEGEGGLLDLDQYEVLLLKLLEQRGFLRIL